MELSMQDIALIHIACRAFMENEMQQKDRDAYESLLCRLTIIIKGKKLQTMLREKNKLTVSVPPKCLKIGDGNHE